MQAGFKLVVIGIADAGLITDAAEGRPQRPACSVDYRPGCSGVLTAFAKRTAGGGTGRNFAWLAQAEAQRSVARIGCLQHQQMMSLVSHVTQANESAVFNLPLQG